MSDPDNVTIPVPRLPDPTYYGPAPLWWRIARHYLPRPEGVEWSWRNRCVARRAARRAA